MRTLIQNGSALSLIVTVSVMCDAYSGLVHAL
jgi:hypothetical protein